ncbi:ExeM/NucH family extracellular endonuclease [Psychromicrobium xiongbiense]|uniref:ExeM/NucH family extracellular endonuclease n=1 Tax=Psychromicrobium xiongbiense TaxID=3051184 RepID=UPI0025552524|nr:ExeM/NucH family extracellular endonuclease [Psychromicrobium sp. YIM S02556]
MSSTPWRFALGAALAASLVAAPLASTPSFAAEHPLTALPAAPAGSTPSLVINEAYLNGGSTGATFKNKFVELYNPTGSAISIDGWSLQYRSATGSAAPTGIAPLSGTVAAHGYYLIKGNANAANGTDLPTADADASGFSFAAGGGTLVLARKATAVSPLPTGSVIGNPDVADLLGYGSSNTFETAAAPTGSVSTSLNRTAGADTDNNAADFTAAAPTPQSSAGSLPPVDPPVDPSGVTAIKDIQGTGATSPLVGATVTTRGIVTASYPTGGFNGYYLQTPGTGGDIDFATHTASDAVFVYSKDTVGLVKRGDYVEVTGTVSEFGTAGATTTQLNVAAGKLTQLSDVVPAVKPAVSALPATDAQRETLEGMLFHPSGDYTVADNYSLNTYGELGLAAGTSVLVQPNALYPYGSAENQALTASNAARAIGLDDGASTNFLKDANTAAQPLPYLTATDPVRVGSAVTFSSDVIFDQRNGAYKFQPLSQLTPDTAASVQPARFSGTRTATPAPVGGTAKIASFNVQNYFIHTGDQDPNCVPYTDRDGKPITVQKNCNQRGAWDAANLLRQQNKIVAGINGLGTDIVSLEEVENSAKFADSATDRDKALRTLVDALNAAAGAGTWAFVPSPATRPAIADEDVIRTAFIYRPAAVHPVGDSVILDDAAFTGVARQPLAQVFGKNGAGEAAQFLAVVNHFKSKGSAPANDPSDIDLGQGKGNKARVAQAKALLTFTESLKTSRKTNQVVLLGDFNAYSAEDPITLLTGAGYTDLDPQTGKHSYMYQGRAGSLDHVLVSNSFKASVTGADIWNINSVESVARDYSRWNYNVTNFYAADPYAASDHDPVVVGLNLVDAPVMTKELNFLNINDFHGRIDTNTVKFAGTIEQLKAASPAGTALLSAGDNVSASLYASSVQNDQPTIDVLNALGLQASAVGNHEFDKGYTDLVNRISNQQHNAAWAYLGANVYFKGTQNPALPEYTIITVNGLKVAVIGVVTQETGALVSPGGIANLDFGDPVAAVNRVAEKIAAGKLADVIVAEYHEGAGAGTKDGASLDQEIAAGGAFAEIATKTSAAVNVIFTGHTHKEYVWDGPVPGKPGATRPIVQTGSYGENIGQVRLFVDANTGAVTSYSARNVPRITADDAALVAQFPAVSQVKQITDAALAFAKKEGDKPLGTITADITTAYSTDPKTGKAARDDRASESALGHLVADALKATLAAPERGGAEIGIVNPGGLRADLMVKNPGLADGVVTVANANAVLPFVNNLWTTTLTGAQIKTLLEQQWQTNPDGSIPSRPYLALGVSKNVSFTYDPERPLGDHVTSVVINGAPLDPARDYRVGTFSFLTTGGDNFRVFTQGKNAKDSGLIDRDGWFEYLSKNSPVAPDAARRGVALTGAPATATAGQQLTVKLSKADLTSLGTPVSSTVTVRYEPSGVGGGKGWAAPSAVVPADLGSFTVTGGAATLSFTVPAEVNGGRLTLTTDGGTYARLPITVLAAAAVDPGSAGGVPAGSSGSSGGSGSSVGSAADAPADGDLAATGADLAPLVLGILALLGAGIVLTTASRRKAPTGR